MRFPLRCVLTPERTFHLACSLYCSILFVPLAQLLLSDYSLLLASEFWGAAVFARVLCLRTALHTAALSLCSTAASRCVSLHPLRRATARVQHLLHTALQAKFALL